MITLPKATRTRRPSTREKLLTQTVTAILLVIRKRSTRITIMVAVVPKILKLTKFKLIKRTKKKYNNRLSRAKKKSKRRRLTNRSSSSSNMSVNTSISIMRKGTKGTRIRMITRNKVRKSLLRKNSLKRNKRKHLPRLTDLWKSLNRPMPRRKTKREKKRSPWTMK
jgi:hypothetical protein